MLSGLQRHDRCRINRCRVRIKALSAQFPGPDRSVQLHANDVASVVDITEFERAFFVGQRVHGAQWSRTCTSRSGIGQLNGDSACRTAAFIEKLSSDAPVDPAGDIGLRTSIRFNDDLGRPGYWPKLCRKTRGDSNTARGKPCELVAAVIARRRVSCGTAASVRRNSDRDPGEGPKARSR